MYLAAYLNCCVLLILSLRFYFFLGQSMAHGTLKQVFSSAITISELTFITYYASFFVVLRGQLPFSEVQLWPDLICMGCGQLGLALAWACNHV